MRSPSGWTSVRGVLISIYGISTLIVSLAVALVWAFSSRKESPATPKDAEPSGKFDKILSMEHHLYNIIAGADAFLSSVSKAAPDVIFTL